MNNNTNAIVAKLKELVQKGNVSRIVISKDERELVNIPVNLGIVGGVVGLAASKWLVIAAVLATVGFGCAVQVIKEDGSVSDVYSKETAEKTRNVAAGVVSEVKEKLNLDEVLDKAAGVVSEVKEKFSFDEVVDASVEDIPGADEEKKE